MKKEYDAPKAEKLDFDFKNTVSASPLGEDLSSESTSTTTDGMFNSGKHTTCTIYNNNSSNGAHACK